MKGAAVVAGKMRSSQTRLAIACLLHSFPRLRQQNAPPVVYHSNLVIGLGCVATETGERCDVERLVVEWIDAAPVSMLHILVSVAIAPHVSS